MFFRCLLMVWLSAGCLFAGEGALIRIGSEWSLFKGTREPSVALEAWRQPGFDTTPWLRAPSGWGTLYWDDATRLTDMWGKYTSLYLRKEFVVADPSEVVWLVLRADYDGGFVAYLNGDEIVRRGFDSAPGTPVTYDAVAARSTGSITTEIDLSDAIGRLRPGTNVLALQAHRATERSAFSIVPELLANFTRGPFLQNATSNSVQIVWKTPVAADSQVSFGPTPALGGTWRDLTPTNLHVATLTNLLPGTTYRYQVSSAGDRGVAYSIPASFRTFTTRGPVSFMVFADSGNNTLGQYGIARTIQAAAPDLVIQCGDVIYPEFLARWADLRCLSVYQPHLSSTPYFFLPGNHDRYDNPNDFFDTFFLPTNSLTGSECFYSFDHGDAHFVVLDLDMWGGSDYYPGSAQYRWLEDDLARSAKPWKFLFFHPTIRTSGFHQFDDYNGNNLDDHEELQAVIAPLASRYGVQVIFTGHEHNYERFNPVAGVHTIVSGGGGGPLYHFQQADEASSQFWSRFNCVQVTIDGDDLEARALGENGEVFDRMFLRRSPPAGEAYVARRHSPAMASGAANDGDGNIIGQRFDFAGQPIPAMAGKFSNLGRLYVNHDDDFLYLGIEQAMVFANHLVYVFLEAPGLPGLTNLAEIGNGVLDPAGQGADGLDALKNLSFRNFQPGLGCILGDEWADGAFRQFRRSASTFDSGQGVFRLNANLDSIPGVRLQQFNRSPQFEPVDYEANADLIQVAIPLASLGDLQPGDTIKLGAVVGLGGLDETRMAQPLDTGFLGRTREGAGFGPVVLEGIAVRLAPRLNLRAARVNSQTVRLSWEAIVGQRYQLETTDDLLHGFQPVSGPNADITAEAATVTVEESLVPPFAAVRFYRVREQP